MEKTAQEQGVEPVIVFKYNNMKVGVARLMLES